MLSSSTSIVVSLRRRVRFYNKSASSRRDVAWNETVEDMGTAVWWPSTAADAISTSTTRHLEGEIRLAKDLRPTSELGHFSISVRFSPYIILISCIDIWFLAVRRSPMSLHCCWNLVRLSQSPFRAGRNRDHAPERSSHQCLLTSCL